MFGGRAGGLEREAGGEPQDSGDVEDAEAAQGTLPGLDLLILCTRLRRGGVLRASSRTSRRRLRIKLGVFRIHVESEAKTGLEGKTTERREENFTALGGGAPRP